MLPCIWRERTLSVTHAVNGKPPNHYVRSLPIPLVKIAQFQRARFRNSVWVDQNIALNKSSVGDRLYAEGFRDDLPAGAAVRLFVFLELGLVMQNRA
jgi:hypothetical protein